MKFTEISINMKTILFFLVLLPFACFSQTNSLVTEYWLATGFIPKPGITAGTDNSLFLDCDRITDRYYVSVSGTTTTGSRLPGQNQISSESGSYVYFITGFGATSSVSKSLNTSGNESLLLIGIQSSGTRSGGTPTFGGTAMSLLGSVSNLEVYYLVSPPAGATLVIPNTTSEELSVEVNGFVCLGGTATLYTTTTNTTSSTGISTPVPLKTGYSVLAVDFMGYTGSNSDLPTRTQQIIGGYSSADMGIYSSCYICNTTNMTGSVTFGWSCSTATSMNQVIGSFYLN